MGAAAEVSIKNKSKKSLRVSTKLLLDVPLLVAVMLLLILGLLMVYSASWNYSLQAYDSGTYIFTRQLIWVFISLVAAAVLTMIDYHILKDLAKWIIVGTLALLFIVLLDPSSSSSGSGYTRALTSSGSIQPSELAKIALIIYLALWLSKNQESLSKFAVGFIPALSIIGVVAFLVFLQPDISATISIMVLGSLMFFIAGGNMKHIGAIIFIAVMLLICGYYLFDKVEIRINDFINGLVNPEEASYHIRRSYNAILNGGLFGVGLGKSLAKLTGLPVAWTDSIFAVILEEVGLFGGCIFIALYLVILWRGFEIFRKAPDMFGKLLAAGVTIWITLEASMNICVMLNILPFAGNALPLVSFGGSSMLCTMVGIGILMSVSRVSEIESIQKGRTEPDALINLRRGDWGWRVSRPGSSSSSD